MDGENQFHAIFGDGPCHIVHPSSLAVPVIAYGGALPRASGRAVRARSMRGEFFQMPNANLYGENVLQPNEIITHVILPAPGQRSAACEVRFKQSHDWPLAVASVNLVMAGSTREVSAHRDGRGGAGAVARAGGRARCSRARRSRKRSRLRRRMRPSPGARPMSGNKYDSDCENSR